MRTCSNCFATRPGLEIQCSGVLGSWDRLVVCFYGRSLVRDMELGWADTLERGAWVGYIAGGLVTYLFN